MFSFAVFRQSWLGRAAGAVAFVLLATLFLVAAGTASAFSFIAWLFRAPWFWILGGLAIAVTFFGGMLWSAWRAVLELDEPPEEVKQT